MVVKFHPATEKVLKEMGWERSPHDSKFKGQWCTIEECKVVSIDDSQELHDKFMFEVIPKAEDKAFKDNSRKRLYGKKSAENKAVRNCDRMFI